MNLPIKWKYSNIPGILHGRPGLGLPEGSYIYFEGGRYTKLEYEDVLRRPNDYSNIGRGEVDKHPRLL